MSLNRFNRALFFLSGVASGVPLDSHDFKDAMVDSVEKSHGFFAERFEVYVYYILAMLEVG